MKSKRTTRLVLFVLVLALWGGETLSAESGADSGSKAVGDVVDQFNFADDLYIRNIAFIGEAMFVLENTNYYIYEIDIDDGTILTTLDASGTGTPMTGLAWDGECFWFDDYFSAMIHRISRFDAAIFDSFSSPGATPMGMTYDGLYLWNLDATDDKLYKLDPDTGAVEDSFDLVYTGHEIRGVAYDGELVWYGDSDTGEIYGLNPDTGALVTTITAPTGEYIVGLGYDGEYLWANVQDYYDVGTMWVAAYQLDLEHTVCTTDAGCDDSNDCTDDVCTGAGLVVERFYDDSFTDHDSAHSTEGNIFYATTDTVLTGARTYLELSGTTSITLGVYESDTTTYSDYELIETKTVSFGAGSGWYEISGVNVPITTGHYYAIVFAWDTETVGWRHSNPPGADNTEYPVSFGLRVGDIDDQANYLPEPPPASNLYYDSFMPHQEIYTTGSGHCTYTNNTGTCEDGDFCTVDDVCAAGTCTPGSARDCDDSEWCTGDETCDETNDQCVSSGDPCDADETCDETNDECVENVDDDTTDDDTADDDTTDDDISDDDAGDDDEDDDAGDDDATGGGDDDDDDDDGCCGC